MTQTIESTFDKIEAHQLLSGPAFEITRDTIKDFAEASEDLNPLHYDDQYMEGNFGKTQFGGVIAHGMSTFALITRMITDWVYPLGGTHRRLEARWVSPVRPGDTITPQAFVIEKTQTQNENWVVLQIEVNNQNNETIATGQAMVVLP